MSELTQGITVHETDPQTTPEQTGTPADGYTKAQPADSYWYDALPEDIRQAPSVQKFKTVDDMAKSYLNLEKKISSKGILLPGTDAPQERWDEFYNTLGRPQAADGYEVGRPDDLPDGVPYDADAEQFYKEIAHKAGLSNQQAQALWNAWNSRAIEQWQGHAKQRDEAHNNAITELRKEWGDKYNRNIKAAQSLVRNFGGKDFAEMLDQSGLGDNPVMIKALASIANQIGEHLLVDNYSPIIDGDDMLSRDQLEQMMRDPKYADPLKRDAAFVKKVDQGFERLVLSQAKQ